MSLPLPTPSLGGGPIRASTTRRVVFLHVGAPKTGTTFLQGVLWKNEDRLRELGYQLPLGNFHGQYRATMDARGAADNAPHLAHARGSWDLLVDEVLGWSGGYSIVSHELMAGADADHARAAVARLSPAEVHVIYTARDLARQIPAEWQEHVKHRSTIASNQFVRAVVSRGPAARWFWQVQDPVGVLSRWGADLPPEQVHLVTVPPKGADPSLLWSRFAQVLGLDPNACDLDIARNNESLGVAQVEVLRRVNLALGDRLPFPGPYPRFGKELLAQQILASQDNTPAFSLRPALRPWLEDTAQRTIARLRDARFDVVGDLDDLMPGSLERAVVPDELPHAELADAAIQALADLLVRHQRVVLGRRDRARPEPPPSPAG